MRHRKSGRKLNRNSSHRNAMFRNMVTSLFKYDRIKTTDAKAKELRGLADHLVTLAKRGDLHARRQALSIVREKDVVHKLFDEAGKRFGSVSGGYTRIIKIGMRRGDAAPVSIIELVTPETGKKKDKKKKIKQVEAVEKAQTAPIASVDKTEPPSSPEPETELSAVPEKEAVDTQEDHPIETASVAEPGVSEETSVVAESETDEEVQPADDQNAASPEDDVSVEKKTALEEKALDDKPSEK